MALELAAQESVGVTIPGGLQERRKKKKKKTHSTKKKKKKNTLLNSKSTDLEFSRVV